MKSFESVLKNVREALRDIEELTPCQSFVLTNILRDDLGDDLATIPEDVIKEELEAFNAELISQGSAPWEIEEVRVSPLGEVSHWEEGNGWQPTGLFFGRDSWS